MAALERHHLLQVLVLLGREVVVAVLITGARRERVALVAVQMALVITQHQQVLLLIPAAVAVVSED